MVSPDALTYIINHVVLPAKLPQTATEPGVAGKEGIRALLKLLCECSENFSTALDLEKQEGWKVVETMIHNFWEVYRANHSQGLLKQTLRAMRANDIRVFALEAQNAALFIQRTTENFIFSCFELSAPANNVMSTEGALVWTLPGRSIAVSVDTLRQGCFIEQISLLLHRLAHESIEDMQAVSSKSGSITRETRDTTSPAMVTDMLMAFLAGYGKVVPISSIQKRIRDERLILDTSIPWMRSPLWTLMKAAIQLACMHLFPGGSHQLPYKNFICSLLSKIIEMNLTASGSLDNNYAATAKLVRRTLKMGDTLYPSIGSEVKVIVNWSRSWMNAAWSKAQDHQKVRLPKSDWTFSPAMVSLNMDHCKDSIVKILEREPTNMLQKAHKPFCTRRLHVVRGIPVVDFDGVGLELALFDFERWVSTQLPTREFETSTISIVALASLLETYTKAAWQHYQGNAEQLSVMLLTAVEIWIAIDELAVKQWQLLKDFQTEIPVCFLEACLLKERSQMRRLYVVETYLRSRQQKAESGSIFGITSKSCLGARFFDQSPDHQQLRNAIETEATRLWTLKKAEWSRLSESYNSLTQESSKLECTYWKDEDDVSRHKFDCRKCDLLSQAKNISIEKYEWPLPHEEAALKAAVFELDVPSGVGAWRSATWRVAFDLGLRKTASGEPLEGKLHQFPGLKDFHRNQGPRIIFGSTTKSFRRSHYRSANFPVAQSSLLVHHGQQYQLFDEKKQCWLARQHTEANPSRFCRSLMSKESPYGYLQYAVDEIKHSPNSVIATQNDARDIDLHEHIAFASLRAGRALQWPNISQSLVTPDLSLNKVETSILILQAALQAGPGDRMSILRQAHQIFDDCNFVGALLSNVDRRFASIRANWKEGSALLLLIRITLRIRSLAPSGQIKDKATDMLRVMRSVGLVWTRELNALCVNDKSDPSAALKNHLLRAAFASKATFDGEDLLTTDDENGIAAFIEASLYLYDHKPAAASDLPKELQHLSCADRRISHSLEPVLRTTVEDNRTGINNGVKAYWDRLPADCIWKCLPGVNERWIETTVSVGGGLGTMNVHLNLLTGEFLMNGGPLGRLPREIKTHSLYRKVLGHFDPQVMISELPGLDYVTKAPIHQHYLYFSKRADELIMQAHNENAILELLPSFLLRDDLPACLVDESVHWMDIKRREIEIRPLSVAWTSSENNWKLSNQQGQWSARRHNEQLIDNRVSFYQEAISIMAPIEEAKHVLVTASDSGVLQASLPRFSLKFFVNKTQALECRERKAVIDVCQELGCFIGFRSYLVLQHTGSTSQNYKRQLIIPQGELRMTPNNNGRPKVHVQNTDAPTIQHCTFTIDTILGRVQSEGVWDGLYKAYLHAVTSSVLPDPLTGRTGTEEALRHLRSVHLLEPPSPSITSILQKIQELSPKREYYPTYLKCMQRVKWNLALSAYSQHEHFEVIAKQIHDNGMRLSTFYEGLQFEKSIEARSCDFLLKRAVLRNATFRTMNYGGEARGRDKDRPYQTRIRCDWDEKSGKVFQVSSFISSWSHMATIVEDLPTTLRKYGVVSGFESTFSIYGPVTLSSMLHMPLSANWGSIFNMCRAAEQPVSSQVAVLLSLLAYGGADISNLMTLAAIMTSGAFADDDSLSDDSYELSRGSKPSEDFMSSIKGCITVKKPPFTHVNLQTENDRKLEKKYAEAQRECEAIHEHLMEQWPTSHPIITRYVTSLLNFRQLCYITRTKFRTWHANKILLEYFEDIQKTLRSFVKTPASTQSLNRSINGQSIPLRNWRDPYPAVDPRKCKHSSSAPANLTFKPEHLVERGTETVELGQLLDSLRCVDTEYIGDLFASLECYKLSKSYTLPAHIPVSIAALQENCRDWRRLVLERLQDFIEAYRKQVASEVLPDAWEFGARITPDEILMHLRTRPDDKGYVLSVLKFASAIASLQRCQRLITHAENQDLTNFVKEAEHCDSKVWNKQNYPEWLSLEIENDFKIRPLQATVALEMINPSSRGNSTMQLNMGEGKSAVIVHMVAATLANTRQLCRVLILKPLMRQMMDLLSKRHQGVASRPLYHIPFSRNTRMSSAVLEKMTTLWMECRAAGGILLVQPEHMLSFKLMAIERLSSDPPLGRHLFDAFQKHRGMSRDILDESDEILSATFQLVYAIGIQKHLQGYPDRWTCQASVLDIVESSLQSHAIDGASPHIAHDGAFPRVIFAKSSAGKALIFDVTHRLIRTGAPRLTFDVLSSQVQEMVARLLINDEISQADWTLAEKQFDEPALHNLLLLRGLLAGGILLHCLQAKRSLVDYGLDLNRSKLAVPYKAKRVPSPRSEFGHPDVGVLFTHLSYYYEGLNKTQLRQAFDMLYRSPDPSQEYISWSRRSSDLPSDLRDLRGVNLEDATQFSQLLMPHLKFNKKTIDFYLAAVVFPAEAKEFSQKLSTSAWDIPAEDKSPVTTGFSGTNDNKSLLPKYIQQEDIAELQGTNAMVMSYLLRTQNRICLQLFRADGQPPEFTDLAELMLRQQTRPQVLIDVGALIIESGNEEVAMQWLKMDHEMEAALYFDTNHDMIVVDRAGRKERFLSSPYKDCLDKCLVYLDEYHTRGTDLKLPANARAAVTISPWLTKDRLVQACMRMRRLSQGQSLFFIVNEEVKTAMLETSQDRTTGELDSCDVLRFCLLRTCAENERFRPLWASYGISHRRRYCAEQVFCASDKTAADKKVLLSETIEADARSLVELYSPSVARSTDKSMSRLVGNVGEDSMIRDLRKFFDQLPKGLTQKSCFHEEQEREVDQEVQRMEEKQRPRSVAHCTHRISTGLREFISTGTLPSPNEMMKASVSLRKASFVFKLMDEEIFSELLVTSDFMDPVILGANDPSDYYLPPPNYVLTSALDEHLVVISQFEANELFWDIYKSNCVSLRTYAPRTMKSMRALDEVGLHTFGGSPEHASQPWTVKQRRALNLFAGQLYFGSLEEYNALRTQFQATETEEATGGDATLNMLSYLTAARRKGKPFVATHMGKLVVGRSLTAEEV